MAECCDWEARYKSLFNGLDKLEKTIFTQNIQLEAMKQNLENSQKAIDLNKVILRNAIEGHNAKEQEYIAVINRLRDRLMGVDFGGDID